MNLHVNPFVIVFFFIFIPAVAGQQKVKLSLAQRELALNLIETSKSYNDGQTDKQILCEITARRMILADGTESLIVTTYHFDYRNGHTVRSTANLRTKKSQSVQLAHYTPPLAPEERLRALQIALAKVPEVRALYDGGKEPVTSFLPSVVVNKEDELLGHRIVEIQLVERTGDVSSRTTAVVDLTAGTLLDAPDRGRDPPDRQSTETEQHGGAPAATVQQMFPLEAPAAEQETGWRVTFGIEHHGSGEILFIKEAHFLRTKDDAWFQVLGDCRLAEMFVPYNDGRTRYYDVTAVGGDLVCLHDNDFGPRCLGTPQRYLGDKVAVEFHDNRLLWVDHDLDTDKQSRRGEEMHIWSVLPTGNYAYPMLFTFRSDGSVGFHVSATAHNLRDSKDDDIATHLHMGCWRLNIVLDDQSKNSIETVRFESSPAMSAAARTVVNLFNGGIEGGIVWTPDDLLRLRITNDIAFNSHNPPEKVSYELVPHSRRGNGRTYGAGEEWTHKDLWVTLPSSIGDEYQDRYRELPDYVARPRSFATERAVIWCKATLVHRARDEDFGKVDYDPERGVALTSWIGYNLSPRNLFAKTPLYPR